MHWHGSLLLGASLGSIVGFAKQNEFPTEGVQSEEPAFLFDE
jgi:hypothetical protein